MITVRIPKDIREYKEKLVAGLTMRATICMLAGGLTAGIFLYLNHKMFHYTSDTVGFVIMGIAVPFGLIGFFNPEGMPFEKYFKMVIDFTRANKKLVFCSANVYKPYAEQKLKPKDAQKRSIERAIIFAEAVENGEDITLAQADEKLVTVKDPNNKKAPKNDKKDKKTKLQIREEILKKAYDNIKNKQSSMPHYYLTDKDISAIKNYNIFMENKRKAELKKKSAPIKQKNKKAKKTRVKTTLPKTVQDCMPYFIEHTDGIFEVENGVFSMVYAVDDMNYYTAEESKQVDIFAMYAEFLNSFDESVTVTIYIDNRVVSQSEAERRIFYPMAGDKFDDLRHSYNGIMKSQMKRGRNDMVQAKYLSITINALSIGEAEKRFQKLDIQVENGIKKLGTTAKSLNNKERLEILHDKFRQGREGTFTIDLDGIMWQGISSKDYIAPNYIQVKHKHIVVDDRLYYRTVWLNNLPTALGDDFFREFVDNNFPFTTAINIVPIPQGDTTKMVMRQKTGMEGDIIKAQKRASKSGYSPEIAVPTKTKMAYNDAEELYDDVTNKSQKMFLVSLLITFSAPDEETLDQYEEEIASKARKVTAQIQELGYRQVDGLKATFMQGVPCTKLGINRALTSESTAVFVPFACQELFHKGGFYYGLNGVSRNLIMLDRTKLRTPSGFVLGSSGSGKSFAVKREALNVMLNDNTTPVLIIDPENEYTPFVKAFDGEAINISTTSDCHINPMEMSENYGLDEDDPLDLPLEKKKEKALKKKSDYIMGIIECMLATGGGKKLSPQQKSFIDLCVQKVYQLYLNSDFNPELLPTLQDLQFVFDDNIQQKDNDGNIIKDHGQDAKLVADGTRLYTTGSMNLFSYKSNVNLNNRIISFNIRDLGNQLKQLALLIVLDFIWNKMCEGNASGTRTYCYADEIHVLFKNLTSAEYLQQLYKRGRKYGLVITGITQDIEDLMSTAIGRGMIANSEFLLFLKQSDKAMEELCTILNLSEAQAEELRTAPVGSGIIKAGDVIVPFVDNFPKDNPIYALMSTNFNEKVKKNS